MKSFNSLSLASPAEAQFGLGKKVQNAVARKAGV